MNLNVTTYLSILIACHLMSSCSKGSSGSKAQDGDKITGNEQNSGDEIPPPAGPIVQDPDEKIPPGPAHTISGAVGMLAIDSAFDYTVDAYRLSDDGERLDKIGSAVVDANGAFTIGVASPGSLAIELEVSKQGPGLSLTNSEGEKLYRSYLPSLDGSAQVGINIVTEAAMMRMEAIRGADDSKSFQSALSQARAETSALTGVKSVFAAPKALATGGNDDQTKLGLYLDGLKSFQSDRDVSEAQMVGAFLTDFTDGKLDARNADGNIKVGEFDLFRKSYTDEMRHAMKVAVASNSDSKIDYNNIPKLDANPYFAISGMSAEDMAAYEPAASQAFSNWVEVIHAGKSVVGVPYDLAHTDGVGQCIGPFKLRKVDKFGRSLLNTAFVEFSLNRMSGSPAEEFFSDGACATPVVSDKIALDIGASETQDFWIKPNTVASPGFSALATGYDYAQLYLNMEYNTKMVSSVLRFVIIDDESKFPDGNFKFIGSVDSPVERDTCYTAAAYMSGGVAPFSVTVTGLNNNVLFKPVGVGNNLQFYSDASCTVTTTSTNIAAGQKAGVFYISLPATYARTGGIENEFSLSGNFTQMISAFETFSKHYGAIE